MKIAVTTDQLYPVHRFALDWLKQHGYEPVLFGALKSNQEEPWVKAASEAAQAIKDTVMGCKSFFPFLIKIFCQRK
jgi:ribose 5-phosphate isomerase B